MTAPRPPTEASLRLAERASWGQRPAPEPMRAKRPRMRRVSRKPIVKGSLRGFATVELLPGLRIADCPVLISNGKAWANLPSKPVLGREGRQAEVSGKKQYASILEWKNRDLSDRFSDSLIALIIERHPDALDDGGAA